MDLILLRLLSTLAEMISLHSSLNYWNLTFPLAQNTEKICELIWSCFSLGAAVMGVVL